MDQCSCSKVRQNDLMSWFYAPKLSIPLIQTKRFFVFSDLWFKYVVHATPWKKLFEYCKWSMQSSNCVGRIFQTRRNFVDSFNVIFLVIDAPTKICESSTIIDAVRPTLCPCMDAFANESSCCDHYLKNMKTEHFWFKMLNIPFWFFGIN